MSSNAGKGAKGLEAVRSTATPDSMKNTDVIKMVSMGLPAGIISGAIRQAASRDFDLTANGLINLKNNNVPDSIIVVMRDSGQTAAPVSAPSAQAPAVTQEPRFLTFRMWASSTNWTQVHVSSPLERVVAISNIVRAERLIDSPMIYSALGARSPIRLSPTSSLVVKLPPQKGVNSFVLAYDNTNGLATGLAVANLGSQMESVTVVARDDTGATLAQNQIQLVGNGHTQFMLTNPAQGFPATDGKRGTVEFQVPAGGLISALGIRAVASTGVITTIPMCWPKSSDNADLNQP